MNYINLYKVHKRVGNKSNNVVWHVKANCFQTYTIHKTRKEALLVCKQKMMHLTK